jgi:hypothetical protein
MKTVSPVDVIKDNFGRKGVAVSWRGRPARGWLKIQTDARMRKARGRRPVRRRAGAGPQA